MPKRILIFSLTYLPFIGGAEIAVKEITDRMDPKEYEFDLITLRFDSTLPKEEKIGNIRVHRMGFATNKPTMTDLSRLPLKLNKYFFPKFSYLKARALHRKQSYDATWAIMANYAGFAALFFKLFHPNVRFLLTLQEGDPISYIKRRVGLLYPLFAMIFRKADVIQTISTYLADFARSMSTRAPVEVVHNGVDVAGFGREHSSEELRVIEQKINRQPDCRYLITVSRLVRKNAVDDLIRAMAQLPRTIHVLIIGTGPDESRLHALVSELHLGERVQFLGEMPHKEIPKYLNVADIFVRPSRSEGMGNVLVEAMAAGVPVIATPIGGIVDFLFDPEKNPGKEPTGLFCAVDDPESIVRQVERLLHDEKLRDALVANARALVQREYDWGTIAAAMRTQVFAKLL